MVGHWTPEISCNLLQKQERNVPSLPVVLWQLTLCLKVSLHYSIVTVSDLIYFQYGGSCRIVTCRYLRLVLFLFVSEYLVLTIWRGSMFWAEILTTRLLRNLIVSFEVWTRYIEVGGLLPGQVLYQHGATALTQDWAMDIVESVPDSFLCSVLTELNLDFVISDKSVKPSLLRPNLGFFLTLVNQMA